MEKQNNRKKGTFGRLLRYIFQNYRIHLIMGVFKDKEYKKIKKRVTANGVDSNEGEVI